MDTPRYVSASPPLRNDFKSGRRFKFHPEHASILPYVPVKAAEYATTISLRKETIVRNLIVVFGKEYVEVLEGVKGVCVETSSVIITVIESCPGVPILDAVLDMFYCVGLRVNGQNPKPTNDKRQHHPPDLLGSVWL